MVNRSGFHSRRQNSWNWSSTTRCTGDSKESSVQVVLRHDPRAQERGKEERERERGKDERSVMEPPELISFLVVAFHSLLTDTATPFISLLPCNSTGHNFFSSFRLWLQFCNLKFKYGPRSQFHCIFSFFPSYQGLI
jgi:hypothetical protein